MTPRVAIVTGGAGPGLGSGITCALIENGWRVLVADRDENHIRDLKGLIAKTDADLDFVQVDLTADNAPEMIVNAALHSWGRIDGLVLNAGIGCHAPVTAITDQQFDNTFDVNVRACFRLVRTTVAHLPKPGGTIVTLASVHGQQPLPGFSVYAATKGAIEALTRGMAVDLGQLGIRANCVVPGMVDCPQTRSISAQYTDDVDEYLNRWARERQLLPSLVSNKNVGELVVFLLSDRSSGITGQSIVIDAGTTLMLTDRN